jgi:hypothetical protein
VTGGDLMNYNNTELSNATDDDTLSNAEKEEFAGIMLVDKALSILAISAILAVSAAYWFVFLSFAVQLEPLVYSYLGVGQ